jgi:hypothetical protein
MNWLVEQTGDTFPSARPIKNGVILQNKSDTTFCRITYKAKNFCFDTVSSRLHESGVGPDMVRAVYLDVTASGNPDCYKWLWSFRMRDPPSFLQVGQLGQCLDYKLKPHDTDAFIRGVVSRGFQCLRRFADKTRLDKASIVDGCHFKSGIALPQTTVCADYSDWYWKRNRKVQK